MTENPSITCEPKVLANALAAVKPAVSSRSAIQVLAGVRITSKNLRATLTASDMGLFIRRELPANGVGELDVLVSHAELVKVAKAFAKRDSVTLELVNETVAENPPAHVLTLMCSSGNRKIGLRQLRLEDHPPFPNTGGFEIVAGVAGADLARAIERVERFASKDETRPVLTGIRLEEENGDLVMVATDSYRLHLVHTNLAAQKGGYIIPGRALKVAAKLMAAEPSVTLRAYRPEEQLAGAPAGFAILEWPETLIAARLIDGQYPNYRQLLPDSFPNEVTVNLPELREACDIACQFITGNAPVRFYANGVVKLHASVPDGASIEEVLEGAKAYLENPSDEFEIGFNPEFLRDAARTLDGDYAVVRLISPLRPALIETAQGAEKHLLMPIRLNV